MREMRGNTTLVLDSKNKEYFHLIDGGVADNLGLRAIEETIDAVGNAWTSLKLMGREKVRKVVFIVVNAETKIESSWNRTAIIPPLAAMISSYSSIAIARYNLETMALLQESFARWTDQVRTGRCPPGQVSREPGSCGDIEYYMVEVRFELLADPCREGLAVRIAHLFSAAPRGRGQAEGRCPQNPG